MSKLNYYPVHIKACLCNFVKKTIICSSFLYSLLYSCSTVTTSFTKIWGGNWILQNKFSWLIVISTILWNMISQFEAKIAKINFAKTCSAKISALNVLVKLHLQRMLMWVKQRHLFFTAWKCPYSEFFWFVFSRIRTECGEIQGIFPYSCRLQENTCKKTSEYGYFSRRALFTTNDSFMTVTREFSQRRTFWYSCQFKIPIWFRKSKAKFFVAKIQDLCNVHFKEYGLWVLKQIRKKFVLIFCKFHYI